MFEDNNGLFSHKIPLFNRFDQASGSWNMTKRSIHCKLCREARMNGSWPPRRTNRGLWTILLLLLMMMMMITCWESQWMTWPLISLHILLFCKSPFLVQEPFVGPTKKYSARIFKYSSLNQIGVINILFFSVARSSSLAQVRWKTLRETARKVHRAYRTKP